MNLLLAFFFNLFFHSILTFFAGLFFYHVFVKLFNIKNFKILYVLRWVVLILPLLDFLKYDYFSWTLFHNLNPLTASDGSRTLFVKLGLTWPPDFIFNIGMSLLNTFRFSLADVCFLSLPNAFQWILGLFSVLAIALGIFKTMMSFLRVFFLKKYLLKKFELFPFPKKCNRFLKKFFKENHIRLALSLKIGSPCFVQKKKPLIFFPKKLMKNLTTKEIEAILFHEYAHFSRKDDFFNQRTLALCQFFWFVPFYKKFAKRGEFFREMICDAYALEMGVDPKCLTEALVKSAHSQLEGLVFFSTPSALFQRIQTLEKISDFKKKENLVKLLFLWSFVVVFVLFGKFLIF